MSDQASPSGAQRRIEDAAIRLFSARGSSRITVSELADAAGVARGTIYVYQGTIKRGGWLFNMKNGKKVKVPRLVRMHSDEMQGRINASLGPVSDPAEGLAVAIRLFVRRAHAEPDWGRFVCRFGLSDTAMQDLLTGAPARAIARGRRRGRYPLREDLLPAVLPLIASATLTAMWMVLEGHQTWRDAGSCTAELILRALGLPPDEAQAIAQRPLPDLAQNPDATTPPLPCP